MPPSNFKNKVHSIYAIQVHFEWGLGHWACALHCTAATSSFPLKLHIPLTNSNPQTPNSKTNLNNSKPTTIFFFLPSPHTTMELSSLLPPFFTHKKVLQAGLWSVWTCGLLLIWVSLYATQMLPSLKDHIKKPKLQQTQEPSDLKIGIFSAAHPFTGSIGARQVLAVRSWLGLSPNINVVLFSQDPSVASFVGTFGSRVSVEPNIDFTFLGTPFRHSMVARAQASPSDVSVLIDPETVLLPTFISTLNHASKLDNDWLLVASIRNVSYFPFRLDEKGRQWLRDDGKRIGHEKVQELLVQNSWRGYCEEKLLMAWNNVGFPLHVGVLPPFLNGKGNHNQWMINEALSFDTRFIFDASWTISNFYLTDVDNHSSQLAEDLRIPEFEGRRWESIANSHLAALYGSRSFSLDNFPRLVSFIKCGGQHIFFDRDNNIIYPLGYGSPINWWEGKRLNFWREKEMIKCVDRIKKVGEVMNCSKSNHLKSATLLEMPFSLESLLAIVADKNKTIILAVAGYSYKDMLMSWVCRMRHLRIMNFLVCALDDELYEFSIFQGLPVFKDSLAPNNVSFNNCHFGTKCFQRVTKVKSRLVLQILKLGYNVLLSDVDIYWFENPVPLLYSFGHAILAAQSDEYKETGPINLPRRLNSGFYFARSDTSTVMALEQVVTHAATSDLSEQPSFYDTLCGEGGTNRLGDDRCLEPKTNLTVYFLDRDLFPNGAYQGLWEKKDVKAECLRKGCFILHNNWISGRRKKLERQVSSGLWDYEASTRMCLQNWHKTIP